VNDLQTAIIALIREALVSGDNPLDEAYSMRSDEELARDVFYSYRGPGTDGSGNLRLTMFGLGALQKVYECYEIEFKKGYVLSAKDMLKMDRLCRLPYWVEVKIPKMLVFDAEFATFANMLQGDLGLMGNG